MKREPPKTWTELERVAGIKRTLPPAPTQRDVTNLTRKRLSRRGWRRVFRTR